LLIKELLFEARVINDQRRASAIEIFKNLPNKMIYNPVMNISLESTFEFLFRSE